MNRHFFGLIFFSLIVGTSAVIYGFFAIPLTAMQPVYVFESQPEKRRTCHRERFTRVENSESSIKVVQAVLNKRTDQLNMDFLLDCKHNSTNDFAVRLDFFVKDGSKTRFLATEIVALFPDFDLDNKATSSIIASYDWLDDLKSRDNLYVIPQAVGDLDNYRGLTPLFDENIATPVTLAGRD